MPANPRARARSDAQLDATPIMGLVSILIPMLLLGYAARNLVEVESRLPAIGEQTDEAPPLLPVLTIDKNGFVLTGLDRIEGLDLEEDGSLRLPCIDPGCPAVGAYDLAGLQSVMRQAKDEDPDARSLQLNPSGTVAYEVVIAAMDATRDEPDGLGGRRELFPDVTVQGG